MVTVQNPLPRTFYEQPDRKSVEKLLKIVEAAYHGLAGEVTVDELNRAMFFCGRCFRLPQPSSKKAFSWFIDEGNALLNANNWGGFSGTALLVAVLASGDVVWRQHRPALGEVLEIGLDLYQGRPCTTPNAWRAVASGARPLLPPVPSKSAALRSSYPIPVPRTYTIQPDGSTVDLADRATLWSR
jgi:hypothetical protein